MDFDLEHDLRVFLASAPQNIRIIQVVEIIHSALTEHYRFWREPYPGWVRREDDDAMEVQPLNMQIGTAGYEGNLDQMLEIRLDTTDADDELREELDRIPVDTSERVQVVYREYLSDNLEEPMVVGHLIAEAISMEKGVATIQAIAPRFSVTRTGELYDTRSIPMMRAFL